MKVSIIIPVYNGEKFIRECIESALNQNYNDYEIIIVDDGSTDSTLDILTQIEGITVLIKNNGGTASALNIGIKNARGQWIKWLSADDILHVDYLKTIMNDPDPEKIYYTNYRIIDKDGNHIRDFIEPIERNLRTNKEQFDELMKYFYGNGSSSLIHKSVFEKIGMFDDKLRHSEDYDFWLRASKNGILFELIPEFLLSYRNHDDQLTNKIGGSLDGMIKARYR